MIAPVGPLKFYTGTVRRTGSFNWYLDIDAFVIANTKTEALGLLLHAHEDTLAHWWSIEEVENGVGVIHSDRRES